MAKYVETVSLKRSADSSGWEHVTRVTMPDNSTHLGLHVIPDTAVESWGKLSNDPDVVLDLLLFAPYMQVATVEEMERVRALLTPPKKVAQAAAIAQLKAAKIPEEYYPTTTDPLAPLREVLEKEIVNDQVQQGVRSLAGRPGSSSAKSGGSPSGQQYLSPGMVDRFWSVPSGRRRRVSARKSPRHGGDSQTSQQGPTHQRGSSGTRH